MGAFICFLGLVVQLPPRGVVCRSQARCQDYLPRNGGGSESTSIWTKGGKLACSRRPKKQNISLSPSFSLSFSCSFVSSFSFPFSSYFYFSFIFSLSFYASVLFSCFLSACSRLPSCSGGQECLARLRPGEFRSNRKKLGTMIQPKIESFQAIGKWCRGGNRYVEGLLGTPLLETYWFLGFLLFRFLVLWVSWFLRTLFFAFVVSWCLAPGFINF